VGPVAVTVPVMVVCRVHAAMELEAITPILCTYSVSTRSESLAHSDGLTAADEQLSLPSAMPAAWLGGSAAAQLCCGKGAQWFQHGGAEQRHNWAAARAGSIRMAVADVPALCDGGRVDVARLHLAEDVERAGGDRERARAHRTECLHGEALVNLHGQ
jgi:hypothetical protein